MRQPGHRLPGEKKDSSLTVGLNLLKDGAAGTLCLRRHHRRLLAAATCWSSASGASAGPPWPLWCPPGNGGAVLIDCGANAECTPEYLLQFAFMGSLRRARAGPPGARVGLLNIGVEPSRAPSSSGRPTPLLQKADQEGRIRFVGNIEAREAVEGSVDVIVADGYSGNIFLKTMEGTGLFLAREIKKIFKQNLLTKLAAVMVSGGLKRFKKLMDSSEVGGTALVGISKTVIKAHGSSNAYAFQNAIRQASQSVSSGLIENITANIDLMRLDAPEKE